MDSSVCTPGMRDFIENELTFAYSAFYFALTSSEKERAQMEVCRLFRVSARFMSFEELDALWEEIVCRVENM